MGACRGRRERCLPRSTSPPRPPPAVPSRSFATATGCGSTPPPERLKCWSPGSTSAHRSRSTSPPTPKASAARCSPPSAIAAGSPRTARAWWSEPCNRVLTPARGTGTLDCRSMPARCRVGPLGTRAPSPPPPARARPHQPVAHPPMTPEDASRQTADLCRLAPVIPVLVIDDAGLAADLARALVAGGLPVLEVTLRTPAALDAIRAMSEVEGGIVGAGTLLTPADVEAAREAGALFGVSPGATDRLLDAAEAADLPLLPGAATATEAMRLLERGYTMQKFFPAEASGGAKALGSLASPLLQIRFCPTGGVGLKNAPDYLALPNTLCVGGSWVAPKDRVAAGDWGAIEKLASEAATL